MASAMWSLSALVASTLLARPAAAALPPVISTTTAPPTGVYSTIAFSAIPTNPPAAASNYFMATSSATINGVVTPLDGFNVLARSGYSDQNGVVLGALLVRRCTRARRACPCACCAACRSAGRAVTRACQLVPWRAACWLVPWRAR